LRSEIISLDGEPGVGEDAGLRFDRRTDAGGHGAGCLPGSRRAGADHS